MVQYPAPYVMLSRLAFILRCPVVSAEPKIRRGEFPAEHKFRAYWSVKRGAWVRESDGNVPPFVLSLDKNAGGYAIHMHKGHESGVTHEVVRRTTALGIARAVWAFEEIARAQAMLRGES